MIYLCVFLILLVPSIRYDLFSKRGGEGLWYQICLWVLILLAAFRFRTGGDSITYQDLFAEYPKISELKRFDFLSAEFNPMWYICNSVFKSLGNSFFLFQLVHAIFVNVVIFRFLYRYCNYFFIAVLVYYVGYYFYFNMEILREIICICLFLIAFPLLMEKRYFAYYLISVFALFFHFSALVLLFVPLFLVLKRDRFMLCMLLCVGISLFLLKYDLVDVILTSFLGKEVSLVRQYLSMDKPNLTGAATIFLNAIPFLILFYVREKYEFNNDQAFGTIVFVVILIHCLGMFVRGPVRLSNYFMLMAMVFLINTVLDNIDRIRHSQVASMLVLCALFIYAFNLSFFYLKSKNSELRGMHVYDRFIPYVSVFNPRVIEKRERLLINEHYRNDIPMVMGNR